MYQIPRCSVYSLFVLSIIWKYSILDGKIYNGKLENNCFHAYVILVPEGGIGTYHSFDIMSHPLLFIIIKMHEEENEN